MGLARRLLYQHVGTFKGILFLVAVTLIVSLLAYTQVLIDRLQDSTRRTLEQKVRLYSVLINSDNSDLIALALEQIQTVEFPIVVADSLGTPKHWKNIAVAQGDTSARSMQTIRGLVKAMDEAGNDPIAVEVNGVRMDWFHYGDSVVIRQLRWLPWIEIVGAALFIIVGYMGFHNIKRSEERMVWVGLAKETAHQLGTPLTSLMGWLELLRTGKAKEQAYDEMQRDLARLEKVSARFSQIGSEPMLSATSLSPLVREIAEYFRRRIPRSETPIEISVQFSCDVVLNVNAELFSWVMENLIKNSIDALRSTGGEIRITCEEKGDWVYVDVADNGPGIPSKIRHNVFRPGFSTKPRGWGLGLSLARRIIEDYHNGRLFIKESASGKGTVMRIALRRNAG